MPSQALDPVNGKNLGDFGSTQNKPLEREIVRRAVLNRQGLSDEEKEDLLAMIGLTC